MTGLYVLVALGLMFSIGAMVVGWWYFKSAAAVSVVALICLLSIGVGTLLSWATTYQNDHWATCTVTGKDRGATDGSYRLYTSDCGTLADQDSVLRGKLNSADLWQQIPNNGVVELEIAGTRVGLFSQFPNVFDVRAVPPKG